MIRNISIGIDIGSSMTRVVVGEFIKGEKLPRVIGTGEAETFGLRHGSVVNSELVADSIKKAVVLAEKSSGVRIKRAFLALSGSTLRGDIISGSAIIGKADGEVTVLDQNKALEDCEDNLNLTNRKIIQVLPQSFKVDGKEVLGRLEGLRGTKIEAKALFITYSTVHLEDLIEALALAGVEAIGIIAAPIATAPITLSEKQKIVGVALVNIGAETTTLSVFENSLLVTLLTFPIGSSDITNDIALGFKTSLEKANDLKLGESDPEFSVKKLNEIIEARLWDIFESIDNQLKKIKRSELLPAGVVYVGGGANTPGLLELSKEALKLPSSLGTTEFFGSAKTKLRDSSWYAALGVIASPKDSTSFSDDSAKTLLKSLKNSLKSGFRQLLP